jgi:hypothetical protein
MNAGHLTMLLREQGAITPMVYDLPADSFKVRPAVSIFCHNCSCGLCVLLDDSFEPTPKQMTGS